jgi:hypothetical protein
MEAWMEDYEKLKKLKEELEELKKHNPSHCYGREGFIDHSMPVHVYERIEEIESEIASIEKKKE